MTISPPMPVKAKSTGADFRVSADAADNFTGITTDVKQVKVRDFGLTNQPLSRYLAKAGWVSEGKPMYSSK